MSNNNPYNPHPGAPYSNMQRAAAYHEMHFPFVNASQGSHPYMAPPHGPSHYGNALPVYPHHNGYQQQAGGYYYPPMYPQSHQQYVYRPSVAPHQNQPQNQYGKEESRTNSMGSNKERFNGMPREHTQASRSRIHAAKDSFNATERQSYSNGKRQQPHSAEKLPYNSSRIEPQRQQYNGTARREPNSSERHQASLPYRQERSHLRPEQPAKPTHGHLQQSKHRRRHSESSSESGSSSESRPSASEQETFWKRKTIQKKKDPVLDNPEEIRKWLSARRKNYPRQGISSDSFRQKQEKKDLSILETKIRRKITLISSDPRNLLKKLRNVDILRRFIINKKCFTAPVKSKGTQREALPAQHSEPTQPLPAVPQQLIQENDEEPQQTLIAHVQSKPAGVAYEYNQRGREESTAESIIKHLMNKQKEDKESLAKLLDYKSNSTSYRYHCQTLETNFVLDEVFRETSYMLQVIRHLLNHNFYDTADAQP